MAHPKSYTDQFNQSQTCDWSILAEKKLEKHDTDEGMVGMSRSEGTELSKLLKISKLT
jgi:hypothetical protein